MYVILNEVRHLCSIVACYHYDSAVIVMHVTMVLNSRKNSYHGNVARMHHTHVCTLCMPIG